MILYRRYTKITVLHLLIQTVHPLVLPADHLQDRRADHPIVQVDHQLDHQVVHQVDLLDAPDLLDRIHLISKKN